MLAWSHWRFLSTFLLPFSLLFPSEAIIPKLIERFGMFRLLFLVCAFLFSSCQASSMSDQLPRRGRTDSTLRLCAALNGSGARPARPGTLRRLSCLAALRVMRRNLLDELPMCQFEALRNFLPQGVCTFRRRQSGLKQRRWCCGRVSIWLVTFSWLRERLPLLLLLDLADVGSVLGNAALVSGIGYWISGTRGILTPSWR